MQNHANANDRNNTARIAKVFRNGSNQAIRLPKDYEIDANEVYISRQGDMIVIRPKPRTWGQYFATAHRLVDDFPEDIEDLPLENDEEL